jgi:hypothetical protein
MKKAVFSWHRHTDGTPIHLAVKASKPKVNLAILRRPGQVTNDLVTDFAS